MWIIFFRDTPHFWLTGGEAYRVGKKDCHVVIQDDRSISRTHLTITVGLGPLEEAAAVDVRHRRSSHGTPQPITLTDSSTYGTSITPAGGEEEGEEETKDSSTGLGASTVSSSGGTSTAALGTGILGLRYASAASARGRSEFTLSRGKSDKTSGAPPALPLTKDQPFDVPVHRAAWGQFAIHLGHHGATLRLVWVDIPVLCEDVDVEMQTKLKHALRYCGVRQEVAATLPATPPLTGAADTHHAASSIPRPPRQPSCNTLSEQSVPDVSAALAVALHSPALLGGGSSMLTLSQRTSTPGTPSVAAPQSNKQADATVSGSEAGVCYNSVSFLVTSTVQPSTAVVGMLCRAVPIVTPAFFVAVRDRASPQVPLPDPGQFLPPPSPWWCDLIQHARQALPATTTITSAAVVPASGVGLTAGEEETADTSATVSPSAASVPPPKPLAEYFTPNPLRCTLFAGVTFVVVQRALYEEVMCYVDCTGAAVVWEGGVGEWVTAESKTAAHALDFSPQGFAALQAFFASHRRHVLLYNATEEMPFAACLPVLLHALGLCSVEYCALIESIVVVHPPSLSDYPDSAHLPQAEKEVRACVRQVISEASGGCDSDTEDSEYDAAATQDGESTKGRPTDAQPVFPDIAAAGQAPQRWSGRPSGNAVSHDDAQLAKRQRKEDEDGWVTLGKVVGGFSHRAPQGAVRTADIHCSPYSLPPYPCFTGAPQATTATEAIELTAHPGEQRRGFVKQALPAAEPLVELEEHRARRQLASSMLVARVPTVDADTVVPEQVVMGGSALNSRAADVSTAAFNTFDTVVHNAASKRRTTAARRGRGGARTNPTAAVARASVCPSTTAPSFGADVAGAVADVDCAADVVEAEPRGSAASSNFHIFDIDGIF